MSTTQYLTTTSYSKLIQDIKTIIRQTKERIAQSVNTELVQSYWMIGQRLCQEKLAHDSPELRDVLQDLAEELDIDYSTLRRCVNFFKTYENGPLDKNIHWSHYKLLLPISDEKQRLWYEELIEEESLTKDQLAAAIQKDLYTQKASRKKTKETSIKLKRPAEATYVYKAVVEHVVDGDTLVLRVDLGFQVWKEQRLRLAEIDCPPMDDPKGIKAYEYVRDQLAQVEFVMIKTNKIDIYGRYVGHVFYSLESSNKAKIFAEGNFLSQELLDKGLAERM